jgi:hypothetical protein
VLGGLMWIVGRRRPLLLLAVPGALVILIGLGWGAWVVEIYSRSHTLAVGYALISISLCIGGAIVSYTGIILCSVQKLVLDLAPGRGGILGEAQETHTLERSADWYWPLLFFGVPGVFLLLVGLGLGVGVMDIYRKTRTLAVGYTIISSALSIAGTLAVFTGIILHSVRELILGMVQPKKGL